MSSNEHTQQQNANVNLPVFPDAASIIDITSRVLEDEGGTAFFECVADSNPITPDMVTWTRTGYDMSAKTKQRSEGSKSYLTVYELVREDTGTFKCIADNGIGEPATRNAKLIVKCKLSAASACKLFGLGGVAVFASVCMCKF